MKLIRHGESGEEKPGLVDDGGGLRDLSGVLRDLAGPGLSRESLDRLARLDPGSLPLLPAGTRLGPCVGGTRNFVAIGLNFADHRARPARRSRRSRSCSTRRPPASSAPTTR